MYRSITRASFRSVADSLYTSKVQKEGWQNVSERMGFSRPFTISEGYSNFIFVGQPAVRSLQVQIINALRLGQRDRASSLLSNLCHGNDSLRADDFIYVLDYCARSPDPSFVMETWRAMELKAIAMNRRCCTFILQALSKGGYLQEAFNWLTFLGGNHRSPVLPMYNIFLKGCAETQSIAYADRCLKLMEDRLIGRSEITYCELLKLAAREQNLSSVHEIWKDCTKYYSPSVISLRKFIWSFTRLGDLGSAYCALQRMVALVFEDSSSIRLSANGRYQSSRLDIPIPAANNKFKYDIKENGFSVPSVYNEHQQTNRELCNDFGMASMELEGHRHNILKDIASVPVMKFLRWSFSDVIHACAQSRNCELAEQLFVQMQSIGLEPTQHTYDGFIKAVVFERGVTYGMKVVKGMENRNMKPNDAILATLSMGYSRILELDLAEALLDQIAQTSQKYIHHFNALLAACNEMDQPERAIRVLAKMKNFKLKSNIRTYELLFSLFGNVNAPYEKGNMLSKIDAAKRIHAIDMDMVKNGVQHSHISMENLLKALGAEGMVRELIQYLHVAGNRFCNTSMYPGTVMYNTVLHSLVEAKESHSAVEVFRNMKSCGLPPDAATYNIMIDCCSIIRSYESACSLVSMMLRDGFYPDTCTYTALIKILLANGDFDKALRLLYQATSDAIQLDVVLFNTILLEAYLKGQIDVIEFIIERMHEEKIQPDPTTCCYTFCAYVDSGFFTTAMEALQVLSMRMISEEERVLQEKRTDFEDLVLDEDPEIDLQIIEIFKDSEHLAAALWNLRWCAIAGFSISWLPNESAWAQRLASSYGS